MVNYWIFKHLAQTIGRADEVFIFSDTPNGQNKQQYSDGWKHGTNAVIIARKAGFIGYLLDGFG
jgi:hypothetical protein